ncbi:MAG TPA: hypothetical protein VIH24_07685 [Candidatus Limnocylindria bacterium]
MAPRPLEPEDSFINDSIENIKEAAMFAAAAITQAHAIDVTFAPPHRSNRPARRNSGGAGLFARLTRPVRRTLATAADETVTPWVPRLSIYPY